MSELTWISIYANWSGDNDLHCGRNYPNIRGIRYMPCSTHVSATPFIFRLIPLNSNLNSFYFNSIQKHFTANKCRPSYSHGWPNSKYDAILQDLLQTWGILAQAIRSALINFSEYMDLRYSNVGTGRICWRKLMMRQIRHTLSFFLVYFLYFN